MIIETKRDVQPEALQILDGPGINSSPVSQRHVDASTMTVLCKSFQATIHFNTNFTFPNVFKYYGAKWKSAQHHFDHDTIAKTIYFSSNNHNRQVIFAVLDFYLPGDISNTYLKLSVPNMSHSKKSISGCCFAGIAVHKMGNIPLKTLCKVTFVHSVVPQNIYSNSKWITLSVYSYAAYANFSATIKIETTPCQSIPLEVCAFSHFCTVESSIFILANVEKCQHFLNHTNSLSSIKFTLDKAGDSIKRPVLKYDSQEVKCVVLQLAVIHNDTIRDEVMLGSDNYCIGLELTPSAIERPNMIIVHRLVGCVDRASARLFIDKFSIRKYRGSDLEYIGAANGAPCFERNFTLVSAYVEPTHFGFVIQLTKSANSWMDIVVTNIHDNRPKEEVLKPGTAKIQNFYIRQASTLVLEITARSQCEQIYQNTSIAPAKILFGSRKVVGRLLVAWEITFRLFCVDATLFITIPGEYRNIAFIANYAGEVLKLKSYIIDLKVPLSSSVSCSKDCRGQNSFWVNVTKSKLRFHYNRKIVLFSEGVYVFLFRVVLRHKVIHDPLVHHSWESAAGVCETFDGHLPEFIDQEKLEEFLTQMKMYDELEIPTLAAAYIGLKVIFHIRIELFPVTCVSAHPLRHA